MQKLDELGLPFAAIARPTDLFDDPHLTASSGLLPIDLSRTHHDATRSSVGLPALPVTFDQRRLGLTRQPPQVGEHSAEIARMAGLSEDEIKQLLTESTLIAGGAG